MCIATEIGERLGGSTERLLCIDDPVDAAHVRDEGAEARGIGEIDKVAIGKIAIKQYSTQQPRFTSFVLVAIALWTLALALKLTVPYLRKFP